MKREDLFVILPKARASVEPDMLVHCNLFPNDNTKFELKHIEFPNELEDVQYLLSPKRAFVFDKEELTNVIYNSWVKINQLINDGTVSKNDIGFDLIYNYVIDSLNDEQQREVDIIKQDEEVEPENNPFPIPKLARKNPWAEALLDQLGGINIDYGRLIPVSGEKQIILNDTFPKRIEGTRINQDNVNYVYWQTKWRRLPR